MSHDPARHVVHSLILGIYITRVTILGSTRVSITDQCSSWLFNCNIAMSKIFECRPVNNRTMRYAAICVLSGNVAFGQNFIPYVDTCQSAMKSLVTIKASADRVLLLSKHQGAASLKCIILSGIIRFLSSKLAIFIEFRYSLSVSPGETHVLPGIIVEIFRGKPEKKKNKTKSKQYKIYLIIQGSPFSLSLSQSVESFSLSVRGRSVKGNM